MRRRQIYAEQASALIASPALEAELKAPVIIASLGLSPFGEENEEPRGKSCPKCGKTLGRGGHFHIKACNG